MNISLNPTASPNLDALETKAISNCLPSWPYTYPYTYPNTSVTPAIIAPPQVWAAFENHGSVIVIFPTEIEALRYAVDRGMRVQQLSWHEEIHDQLLDEEL